MKLQARFYVTTQGCTDAKIARELAFELAAPLDQLYEQKVISGYQSFVLKNEDDYEEYDLDRPLIEQETHSVFPAIFLNVTCRIVEAPAATAAIGPVVAEHGFRHLRTEPET
jgi:hypothetical protein